MTTFLCEVIKPKDVYHASVEALAGIILAVCEPHSSPASIHHGNSNNLDAVPDMLARLGVMRGGRAAHEFAVDWAPPQELPIIGHMGAPSLDDLGLGLEFSAWWYDRVKYVREHDALIQAARSLGRVALTSEDGRSEDEVFNVIEGYWSSRAAAIERLGSEDALYPSLDLRWN